MEEQKKMAYSTDNEVERVLDSIKTYYEWHLWNSWIKAYKNYFWNKTDRAAKIKSFQTNVVFNQVKTQVDSMWTWIYDNVINFRVLGRNKDDHAKADDVKSFLEWWFAASRSNKELMSAAKESLICWNGYWEIGYISVKDKVEYKKWMETKKMDIKEQYPFIKHIDNFNIFHDPTVADMEDSAFVCVRRIMNKKTVYKKYFKQVDNIKTKMLSAMKDPNYFSDYDYSRIKHSLFWSEQASNGLLTTTTTTEFDIWKKNYLSVWYEDQYIEVIEYWEDDRMCILFNWHLVADWKNPLPIKKKPFFTLVYNQVPWIAYGIWLWQALDDVQKVWTEILNLSIDNIKLQIWPMFQKMKWWDVFQNMGKGQRDTLVYSPFKVIETNTPNAITRLDLWTPDFSWIQFMQYLEQLGEKTEWMNAYASWWQGKVERSAAWVTALVQASKSRLLPLTESINRALSKIAEIWITIAVVKMDEDIIVRVTSDSWKVSFKGINVEWLIWKYDIEFSAQSLKSASREIKRAQLNEIMQTAISWATDPNNWQYFLDMPKLWGEILNAHELPADLILNSKQIIKETTKVQYDTQKAQMEMQAKLQKNAPVPAAPEWWAPMPEWWAQMPTWAPMPPQAPTWEQPVVEEPQAPVDSDLLKQALSY